jgi:hypothetical protein
MYYISVINYDEKSLKLVRFISANIVTLKSAGVRLTMRFGKDITLRDNVTGNSIEGANEIMVFLTNACKKAVKMTNRPTKIDLYPQESEVCELDDVAKDTLARTDAFMKRRLQQDRIKTTDTPKFQVKEEMDDDLGRSPRQQVNEVITFNEQDNVNIGDRRGQDLTELVGSDRLSKGKVELDIINGSGTSRDDDMMCKWFSRDFVIV